MQPLSWSRIYQRGIVVTKIGRCLPPRVLLGNYNATRTRSLDIFDALRESTDIRIMQNAEDVYLRLTEYDFTAQPTSNAGIVLAETSGKFIIICE